MTKQEQQLSIEEKISRARTQLLLNQPFFGTLCPRLKLVTMPGFPTMATDGRRVYNPAFVEKLTPAELEGVLAHVALAHHCQRGERDAALWNGAVDYAINSILISNGINLAGGRANQSSVCRSRCRGDLRPAAEARARIRASPASVAIERAVGRCWRRR